MIAAPATAMFAKRVPIRDSLPSTMVLVTAGMYLIGNFGHDDSWTHFLPGVRMSVVSRSGASSPTPPTRS
ncbi:hypothetical protein [Nonomuraea recticatena]|uniref:Uncharacterized protein n=1 Tax=Nonomuraea recticatena TaxID=46178 RepID=A0ABN3T1Z5_9ACTN